MTEAAHAAQLGEQQELLQRMSSRISAIKAAETAARRDLAARQRQDGEMSAGAAGHHPQLALEGESADRFESADPDRQTALQLVELQAALDNATAALGHTTSRPPNGRGAAEPLSPHPSPLALTLTPHPHPSPFTLTLTPHPGTRAAERRSAYR